MNLGRAAALLVILCVWFAFVAVNALVLGLLTGGKAPGWIGFPICLLAAVLEMAALFRLTARLRKRR